MSPRFTTSSAALAPPDHTPTSTLLADSAALQDFSSTHGAGSALVADRAEDEAALVDLAITFGLIGAEFLAAVVEFLRIHRRSIETAAARQEQLASATRRADAGYLECDCAAADREFTL